MRKGLGESFGYQHRQVVDGHNLLGVKRIPHPDVCGLIETSLKRTIDCLVEWLQLNEVSKNLYILLQNYCVFKLQLCVKLTNFNGIQIKRLILLKFFLFTKNQLEEIRQRDILTNMKLSPFPNYLKKQSCST